MHRFKDLEIWKQSRTLCTDVYSLTSSFPDAEKFGLTNQLRRAAVSIPSNIAEGASRSLGKDFSIFLEIAIGSAYELETQLLISCDLGFIEEENLKNIISKLDSIIRMISRFGPLTVMKMKSNNLIIYFENTFR
jgi:four helix bundle protein